MGLFTVHESGLFSWCAIFAIVAKLALNFSRHIQKRLHCICAFYGKEHEACRGARRLSGKVGNDCP